MENEAVGRENDIQKEMKLPKKNKTDLIPIDKPLIEKMASYVASMTDTYRLIDEIIAIKTKTLFNEGSY